MTPGEIMVWLDAAIDRKEQDLRSQKYQAWQIGVACYYAVCAAMNSENKYPSFLEMFPEERSPEQVAADEEAAWQIQKAEFKAALIAGAERS